MVGEAYRVISNKEEEQVKTNSVKYKPQEAAKEQYKFHLPVMIAASFFLLHVPPRAIITPFSVQKSTEHCTNFPTEYNVSFNGGIRCFLTSA